MYTAFMALSSQIVFFYKAAWSLRSDCVLAAVSWRALSSLAVCLRTGCGYAAAVKMAKIA